jgi:transposase
MAARDFAALEARRLRAARLFAVGTLTHAKIARELRVSAVSVHRWHETWCRGGAAALRKSASAGRKARLHKLDLIRLTEALRQGASAHGFPTETWTLSRVARVIERITGARYHPGHVWRILRAKLHLRDDSVAEPTD